MANEDELLPLPKPIPRKAVEAAAAAAVPLAVAAANTEVVPLTPEQQARIVLKALGEPIVIKKAEKAPDATPYQSTGDVVVRNPAAYKAFLKVTQQQISDSVVGYLKDHHYKAEHIKNFTKDLEGRYKLENQGVLGSVLKADSAKPEAERKFSGFGEAVKSFDNNKRYIICVTDEGKSREALCVTDLLAKTELTQSDKTRLYQMAVGPVAGQSAFLSYAVIQHGAQLENDINPIDANFKKLQTAEGKVDDIKTAILAKFKGNDAMQTAIGNWWSAGISAGKYELQGVEIKKGQPVYKGHLDQDIHIVKERPPVEEKNKFSANINKEDLFTFAAPPLNLKEPKKLTVKA